MNNPMISYDVAVIGAGPGGYVAAIKAAQAGKKVVCIDIKSTPGGTCLNVGCIPSKALLCSSHKYYEALHEMANHGIDLGSVSISLKKMMDRKDRVVADLAKGIMSLFGKNGIQFIEGRVSFIDSHTLRITSGSGVESSIIASNIIIATGSESISLPGVVVDEERIVSSTGALSLQSVPAKLAIIGAGVIGLEMGSIWSRLGSEVIVVEYANQILPAFDKDISKEAKKILSDQGLSFTLNAKVQKAEVRDDKVVLSYEQAGESHVIECDILLSAIGRRPYTNGLNLEGIKVGVELNKIGQIVVNANFKTSIPHIYAIGDVIAGPMLAHKASEEGFAVAEIICSHVPIINYNNIPNVIYTHPEIATVGKSEIQLQQENIDYKVSKFPLTANSRSRANGETSGLVKIITDKKSDKIIGAAMVGSGAGELIQEIVIAMEFVASSEDLARICFGHPSIGEAIKEAALGAFDKPIHI